LGSSGRLLGRPWAHPGLIKLLLQPQLAALILLTTFSVVTVSALLVWLRVS
jgi:hypothetical protein